MKFARGAHSFRANAQDRRLPRRANPQMPLVEQEIDAVLFELDRIRLGFRHALHDFDALTCNSYPPGARGSAATFPVTMTLDSCVRPLRGVECVGLLLQRNDALDDARAVAKNREEQLARFAQIVEPSAKGDFLPHMLADMFDRHHGHKHPCLSHFARPEI